MAYNISSQLAIESGRIGKKIYRETVDTSPWLKLIKKETWPDGMGYNISVQLYNRSFTTTVPDWTPMTGPTGSGSGICLDTPDQLTSGSTLTTYGLEMKNLRSDPFCAEFLRFDFEVEEQLKNVLENFRDNVRIYWADFHRTHYTSVCQNKVIANGSLSSGTTSFPAPTGDVSPLTFGMLKVIYRQLILKGGGTNPLGREGGGPAFGLVTGMETIEQLIHDNAAIVQDINFSSQANSLLAPLGVDRTYRGWYFIQDDFPKRWDYVDGAWLERWPFSDSVAVTFGTSTPVSTEYEEAEYEDAYVIHPETAVMMVPQPITSFGSLTKFNPVDYMGMFKWSNFESEDNLWGQIGTYIARLAAGYKPVRPNLGYVIRHKRCGFSLDLTSCSTYAYP